MSFLFVYHWTSRPTYINSDGCLSIFFSQQSAQPGFGKALPGQPSSSASERVRNWIRAQPLVEHLLFVHSNSRRSRYACAKARKPDRSRLGNNMFSTSEANLVGGGNIYYSCYPSSAVSIKKSREREWILIRRSAANSRSTKTWCYLLFFWEGMRH